MNLLQKINYVINAQIKFLSLPNVSLDDLSSGLQDQIDTSLNDAYKRSVINRIIQSYQKAKHDQLSVQSVYRPGHKWAPQISKKRNLYIDALNHGDVERLLSLLNNFYRNNGVISIIKYELYYYLTNRPLQANFAQKKFLYNMIKDIEVWKSEFPDISSSELEVPPIGNPYGYVFENTLVTAASCPAYYYAHKSHQLTRHIDHPIVCEIGGGIGLFAYFLARKISNLTYIGFDLPEILVIAQFFLMNAFPDKKFLLYGESGSIDQEKNVQEFDFILLPNFSLPELPSNAVDLFVNFHSLSEMDYATVEEYIVQIMRTTKGYFFHENSEIKQEIGYGNKEVPAIQFPINLQLFKLNYRTKAIWREIRYWEYLYQRIK
ncbi:MAG: putative sugar O-methyltransferase [Anaerolineaceae bacterium]|nr:putative sugar O-methyltransferase [Anaerolineaceae bacterium]